MAAIQWQDQPRARFDGVLQPAAVMHFFASGTSTRINAYADAALEVPLPNPLTADAAARFPAIWLDLEQTYRIRMVTAEGIEMFDLDPFEVFPGTDSGMPLNDSGEPMPNAQLTFWLASTTILTGIFGDSGLITPLDNPLTANDDGEFPPIYLDDELRYRTCLEDGDGVLIYDVDDYQLLVDSP